MNKFQNNFVLISAFICILACISDIVMLYYFGNCYPGYNQWKDTMSSLGASNSPVSEKVSNWWILIGCLFIFFGVGVRFAYRQKGSPGKWASWLIIFYGLGEEIASGLFKMDRVNGHMTNWAVVHDVLSGLGVLAILILPFVMNKVIIKKENPGFHKLSFIVIVINLMTWLLFAFRISNGAFSFLAEYKGLWQRMMLLNINIYLVAIAVLMIKDSGKHLQTENPTNC